MSVYRTDHPLAGNLMHCEQAFPGGGAQKLCTIVGFHKERRGPIEEARMVCTYWLLSKEWGEDGTFLLKAGGGGGDHSTFAPN